MESFLRGATSYADQMFLLKRGLLEVNACAANIPLIRDVEVVAAQMLLHSLPSTSCFASSTVAALHAMSCRATLTCLESL